MKSNRAQVVLLFVFLYCLSVYGAGQMFLNTINPVKQDTVTFENDVFSYDAVLENVNTNTFQILKQYELNVQVSSISLSGDESVSVSGSLGASIVSQGNIEIAADQNVLLDGHGAAFTALQDFDITSSANTNFYSELATSIQAAGASVTTGSQGINITSAGDVDFSTRDEVYVAGNKLTNTNVGDLTFDASRGDFEIAAGTKISLSSEEITHVNGVLGVNYASSGSFFITSEEAFFFGQAISNLAIGNTEFTYPNTVVAAEEDIKVFGDSVRVTSIESNINVNAPGQYSNILLSSDSGIILSAYSLISLDSQGQAGDVVIISNQFDLTSYTFTSIIGSDLVLGGNNTNNINLSSGSSFTLNGYYLDADVHDYILINSSSNAAFTAAGDIFFQTNSGVSSASNSLTFQSGLSDIYLYSDIGDGTVSLTSLDSMITADANDDLIFDTYDYISHFTGNQVLTVGNLFINAADDDVNFSAAQTISISTNDVTLSGYNIQWNATDRLDFNIGGPINFLCLEGTHLIANGSISLSSTAGTQSYSSGNDINLQNVDTLLFALKAITYNVDTLSLLTGNSVFYAQGTLTLSLYESFHAVITDDFNLDSNKFTVNDTYSYFKSSNIDLIGATSANIYMDTFTGKFGYVLVDATGDALLNTNDKGDINVVSGEDILLSSTGALLLNVGLTTFASAEENLTFTGDSVKVNVGDDFTSNSNSGDQTFQTASTIGMNIRYNSAWSADDISAYADGVYSVTAAGAIQVNGGDATFASGTNDQLLSIQSNANISFSTPANIANSRFQIEENGRALSFNASATYNVQSGDTIHYNSDSLDFSASTISSTADSSLTYSGSTSIINATNTGVFNANNQSRFISGDDDYINVDSAKNLRFTTQTGDFNIYGEGDVKFEAVNFISLFADENIEFDSKYLVTVSADDSLTVLATGIVDDGEGYLEVISHSSVNFDNKNGYDILIRSNNDDVENYVTRDFGIEANGVDELLDCGILLSASARDLSYHSYSSAGTLEILADHCIDIRSFYTDQTTGSTGNINIVSDGHVFLHSETQAVTLLSNGVDASTTHAITLEGYAGVEIQATKSSVYVLGQKGITSYSGNNYDVYGLRGVTLKSNGSLADIDFQSALETFAIGARGLTLAAGTDAPYYAGDFTATAGARLIIESANNILFRSFSTSSSPDAILLTTGSTVVEAKEGAGVFLSAAQDVNVVATDDTSIQGEDGLIRLDADIGDFTVDNTDAISWTTTHGPIGIEGLGSGGSVTFNALSFTSLSYLSTRVDALGSGAITAGTTLDLFSADETACVLVETFRPYDDVTLSAGDEFSLITDANAHVYDIEHVTVAGNNVDIAATQTVSFLQSELFEIGKDSTPIVRVIAGGAGATGVTVNSRGDIEVLTGSTYSSISTLDTTFNSRNINITSQGVILLIAEGTDVPANTNFNINSLNYMDAEADYMEEIAPSAYTVTSTVGTISINSLGDDPGDRVDFDSLTFIHYVGAPVTSGYVYGFDTSYVSAGDLVYNVAGSASLFNTANTFTGGVDYYENRLLALETEKGQIEFITGDTYDITISSSADSVAYHTLIGDVIVDSGFDVNFNIGTSALIDSNDAVYIKAGNNVAITTATLSFAAASVNQYYLYNDLAPRDIHSGELLWTAEDQITVDASNSNLDINVFGDIIFDSYGSFGLTITNAWSLTVSDDTASNIISFESENDIDITVSAGSFTWDDSYFYYNYEANTRDITSGGDMKITAGTKVTASSVLGDVVFEAQSIDITNNAGTLLFNSAQGVYLETLGAHSNVAITVTNAITLGYTLADFIATDLMLISTSNSLTINDLISEYHSLYGDVSFLYSTRATFAAVDDLTFDAYGRNNAKLSAIELNAQALTANADSIYFQGYESADFRAYSSLGTSLITFTGFTDFDVQSTNFGGDIFFYTSNGPTTFNVATSYVSRSDESLYTSAQTSTFDIEGAITFTTHQDYSRFLVRTDSEDSTAIFRQSTTTLINTNRYSEYKTSDKSEFNSQISITGSTSETYTSTRAANANFLYGIPGIEVTSDEYGIWMHHTSGAATATFNADDMDLLSDRAYFHGGTFVMHNDGSGDTQIHAQEDIAINAQFWDLDVTFDALFQTDALDTENHIVVSNPSGSILLESVNDLHVFAMGSNTNIEFINDQVTSLPSTVTFTGGSASATAEEGIRFLTDNSPSSSILFDAATTITITTEDWEDSILVQSDYDLTLQVFTTRGIHQYTYNHRLGFFDQTPDFINFVKLQGYEFCDFAGFCGIDNGNPSGPTADSGFNNISYVTTWLQDYLMEMGLIEYHHGIVDAAVLNGDASTPENSY